MVAVLHILLLAGALLLPIALVALLAWYFVRYRAWRRG